MLQTNQYIIAIATGDVMANRIFTILPNDVDVMLQNGHECLENLPQ